MSTSTTAIQKHEAMSFGLYVVATEYVPLELLEQFGISRSTLVYRRLETEPEVSKHFVKMIVDLSRKIEDLLKTNIEIIITGEEVENMRFRMILVYVSVNLLQKILNSPIIAISPPSFVKHCATHATLSCKLKNSCHASFTTYPTMTPIS